MSNERQMVIASLARHSAFHGGSAEAIAALAAGARLRKLAPQEIVLRRGDPASHVYVLLEGIIRVYQLETSREVTITNLVPPNTFGEMEVIAGRNYLEHAMAVKSAEVIAIEARSFLDYLDRDANCARELLRDVCARFCNSATRERALFFEVPVRLASLVLGYADLAGKDTPEGIQIRLELRQEDLARGLGVTVKSIARTMQDWQKSGWIGRTKGWLVVKNKPALEALCHGARFELNYRFVPK